MKPVIEFEGKAYDVTNIRYYDGVAQEVTYYDADNKLHFLYDINNTVAPHDGIKIDFAKSLIWDGRNDIVINKISNLLETKTNNYNELAHELVSECPEDVRRDRLDDYYTLTGEVAALHEVMKLVK